MEQEIKRHGNWNGGRSFKDVYPTVLIPGHPSANSSGHVREHVLIVEDVLGKPIPKNSVVHHVNGDGHDNRRVNLVLCQDRAYHFLLHKRMRAKKACGNPNYLKCSYCKQYDDPSNMYLYKNTGFHRACHAAYELKRKRVKKDTINDDPFPVIPVVGMRPYCEVVK